MYMFEILQYVRSSSRTMTHFYGKFQRCNNEGLEFYDQKVGEGFFTHEGDIGISALDIFGVNILEFKTRSNATHSFLEH